MSSSWFVHLASDVVAKLEPKSEEERTRFFQILSVEMMHIYTGGMRDMKEMAVAACRRERTEAQNHREWAIAGALGKLGELLETAPCTIDADERLAFRDGRPRR